MEKGERLWYIVGYYLSPGDGTTIWYMEAAMADRPRGAELIVAGNFNMYQENTGGWGWDKEITEAVIKERLEDIQGHFLPQRQVWCKERSTWAMVKQGRAVRSRTDYILVSDLRIFQNMSVWYPRHNSDYLMVIGCLNGAPPEGTLALPWVQDAPPDTSSRLSDKDTCGQDLRATTRGYRRRRGDSLTIKSLRQETGKYQRRHRWLIRAIWEALKEYRRRRA